MTWWLPHFLKLHFREDGQGQQHSHLCLCQSWPFCKGWNPHRPMSCTLCSAWSVNAKWWNKCSGIIQAVFFPYNKSTREWKVMEPPHDVILHLRIHLIILIAREKHSVLQTSMGHGLCSSGYLLLFSKGVGKNLEVTSEFRLLGSLISMISWF